MKKLGSFTNGMESVSSMCMPHTGSRTNRRAAVGTESFRGLPGLWTGACWFWNLPLTMRRRSRKPRKYEQPKQERIARARKFIGISVCQAPAYGIPPQPL